MERFYRREELRSRYAFAIPSPEAIALINGYGPIVEIGAGTGYWAKVLSDHGGDVLAFDLLGLAWEQWFPHGQVEGVVVGRGGSEKAVEHAQRTLLLVWPPYDEAMAHDVLRQYEGAGGRRLVYVGEGPGGCTADDDFFAAIGNGTWKEAATLAIPQWTGIYDNLWVYERVR